MFKRLASGFSSFLFIYFFPAQRSSSYQNVQLVDATLHLEYEEATGPVEMGELPIWV